MNDVFKVVFITGRHQQQLSRKKASSCKVCRLFGKIREYNFYFGYNNMSLILVIQYHILFQHITFSYNTQIKQIKLCIISTNTQFISRYNAHLLMCIIHISIIHNGTHNVYYTHKYTGKLCINLPFSLLNPVKEKLH